MWHYVVLALIVWPTEPTVPAQAPPEAWKALKDTAKALEVVGPHEAWGSNFNLELRYVRQYWRELQDMPEMAATQMLPSPDVANQMCAFNRQFQSYLELQQAMYLHRGDSLEEILCETKQLHETWSSARIARCESESWPNRRRALNRIRCYLGNEDFYSGRLPYPVPIQHFRDID